jgi:hypothetical protein
MKIINPNPGVLHITPEINSGAQGLIITDHTFAQTLMVQSIRLHCSLT